MDLDSLTLFWKRNPIFIAELYKTGLIFVVRPKKLYAFQVTRNFKIGMVGRIFLFQIFTWELYGNRLSEWKNCSGSSKNP